MTAGLNPLYDVTSGGAPSESESDCLADQAGSGWPAGCLAMTETTATATLVSAAVKAAVEAAVAVAEAGHQRLLTEMISGRDETIRRMADEIAALRAAAATEITTGMLALDVESVGLQWSGHCHDFSRCSTAEAMEDSDGMLEARLPLSLLLEQTESEAHAKHTRLPSASSNIMMEWSEVTAVTDPSTISVAPSPPCFEASAILKPVPRSHPGSAASSEIRSKVRQFSSR
jgi:hypothetical protein